MPTKTKPGATTLTGYDNRLSEGHRTTTIALPVELTNGNDGRGNKWFRSNAVRKQLEDILRLHLCTPGEPYQVPVRLSLIRVLGKGQNPWDSDSGLRGNAKELIDALIAIGWFHDDSPRWIVEVRFFQHDRMRECGPSTMLVIEEMEAT